MAGAVDRSLLLRCSFLGQLPLDAIYARPLAPSQEARPPTLAPSASLEGAA